MDIILGVKLVKVVEVRVDLLVVTLVLLVFEKMMSVRASVEAVVMVEPLV